MANEVDLSKIKPINWARVWEKLARIYNAKPTKFILGSADTLGKLTVYFAIAIWLWEFPDRNEQRYNSAWTLINSAHHIPGEAGRRFALQSLNSAGFSLDGIDLTNLALDGINLQNADLYKAIFTNARLRNANFGHSRLASKDTNLSGTNFDGSKLFKVDFTDASLSGSSFIGADLTLVDCDRVYFINATFKNTTIQLTSFREAHFELTKFENVTFEVYSPPYDDVRSDLFYKTVFWGVDLSKTSLSMEALSHSILCNVTMPGGKTVSQNCPDPESLKRAIYR
jgi:uncharacterized protein YjbI with pentapeptide repeats